MIKAAWVGFFISLTFWAPAQTFEVSGLQESYKGTIGETIKAPIRFKNTSDKPVTLIIRKLHEEIGSTQKNFFCLDNNCSDEQIEDFILKVDPGQVINGFQVALEGGLVRGVSLVRYLAFNRSNPNQAVEFDLNFSVEEKAEKEDIYQSRFITLHDVYPNPAIDHAFVNYKILNDRIQAKIRVHNLLGNIVGEYELSASENMMRITTAEFNAGIYFYTLYVDNESVMTRKLIVKK